MLKRSKARVGAVAIAAAAIGGLAFAAPASANEGFLPCDAATISPQIPTVFVRNKTEGNKAYTIVYNIHNSDGSITYNQKQSGNLPSFGQAEHDLPAGQVVSWRLESNGGLTASGDCLAY